MASDKRQLRAWLEAVATMAIDWIDQLDGDVDLEDDDREDDREGVAA